MLAGNCPRRACRSAVMTVWGGGQITTTTTGPMRAWRSCGDVTIRLQCHHFFLLQRFWAVFRSWKFPQGHERDPALNATSRREA